MIAVAFCRRVSARAASLDHPVDALHVAAAAPARWRGLGEQALGAVLVTDDDLVLHGLLRVLRERVSGKAAAQGATDGCDVPASPAPDLVADDAAYHRAAHGPGARGLACFLDLAPYLDHGALAADCSDDDGGRGRNRCISGLAWRRGSRDRFRPGRRLRLGGLTPVAVHSGLLRGPAEARARRPRGRDPGRAPAADGPHGP